MAKKPYSKLPIFIVAWVLIRLSFGLQASTSILSLHTRSVQEQSLPLFLTQSSTYGDECKSPNDTRIFFDISIADTDIGRLVFNLTPHTHPMNMPIHATNLVSLASSSRIGLDPKATYKGCEFQYSPSSIEDGSLRYRWGHVCDGPKTQRKDIDPKDANQSLLRCKQSCFGGTYYGISYDEVLRLIDNEQSSSSEESQAAEKEAVLLTVPTQLGNKFSIVRVSESPREWGERLLLNSVVLGYLDNGSLETLRMMAKQRVGVPTIINCGVLQN